jgi:hypothetical protein
MPTALPVLVQPPSAGTPRGKTQASVFPRNARLAPVRMPMPSCLIVQRALFAESTTPISLAG